MRKKKKQKSWKFYLCVIGILLGTYLALIAMLAIRNPKHHTDQPTKEPVQQEVENEVTPTIIPAVTVELTKKPEKENQEIKPIDEYGREGERYTVMESSDVLLPVSVKVRNKDELSKVAGAGFDSIRSYINIYAAHEGIDATEIEMLDFLYVGFLGERYEIYMEYNDPDETLVTVIYEPASEVHSGHVDVVPCQYTKKEIQKKAWK